MSPKGVEHFNTAEVVLDGGVCIHQCRRKALSTLRGPLMLLLLRSASINVAERR